MLAGKRVSATDLRLEHAYRWRKKLTKTRFIAITGSSGKTTTTLLIDHFLKHGFSTIVSSGANTMTIFTRIILKMKPSVRFGVFEVSGHESGVIDTACQLLQPEVGVVTIVSGEHVSNFRNIENTALEKSRLAANIPARGTVFLNADDSRVLAMREQTSARVITFGTCEEADYRATDVTISAGGRLQFQCHHGSEHQAFEFDLLGRHFVCSALAGIAVAHQQGFRLPELAAHGRTFRGAAGRCSVHPGKDGTIYICDTVKAPFATVGLALETVSAFPDAPRKTIVLGTISDTRRSLSARYQLPIKGALDLADRVILFGSAANRSKISESDWNSGRITRIENISALRDYLDEDRVPGELILLKASFKVDHLERIALNAQAPVDCWQERCGRSEHCFDCQDIRHVPKPSVWRRHLRSLIRHRP